MKKFDLTESELEILTLIWEQEGRTVRSVHDELSLKKDVKYTTTLKMMQNMNEKGVLHRDTNSKLHKYYSSHPKEKMQTHFLGEFVTKLYRGNVSKLVMQALGSSQNTKKEIEEISKYLEDIKKML
jgi:BlaI family penicillinase repressor